MDLLDEVITRESLTSKKEAQEFLIGIYYLEAPQHIRAYARCITRRWGRGITRQHLVELKVLYGVLGQLLGRVKDS